MELTTLQFNIGLIESIIGIIVFVVAIGITWGTLKTKVCHLEKDTCKVREKIDKFVTKEDFKELKKDFRFLFDGFEKAVNTKISMNFGEANSPYKPNKDGIEILKNSNFNEVYEGLKEKIFAFIDEKNPKGLYDIEQYAYSALSSLENDDKMTILKKYIVNNPKYSLSLIKLLGSWIIRDDYVREKDIKMNHQKEKVKDE